jgi:hypothetical protein
LVLPSVFDGDKYEAQIVQLETIRLNGLHTVDLIKSLLDLVNKLSEDVTQFKSDNASLKLQLTKSQQSLDIESINKDHSAAGSLPPQSVSKAHKEVTRNPSGSSAAAYTTSPLSSVPAAGTLLTREVCPTRKSHQ